MALTQADVNPIYIRDILGHADLKTTSVYSKSNLEMKRKALEKVEVKAIPETRLDFRQCLNGFPLKSW
jgi:integrase